jgi:hypothetical protein
VTKPAAPGGILGKLLAGEAVTPDEFHGVIDFHSWAKALLNHEDYQEPNKDYLSTLLMLQTLTSETIDEVFTQGGVRKLQEAVPNVAGASTGPIEIFNIYVTGSDFGEGAKTYVIMTARDMETGIETRYSTGAQQVQAQLLAMLLMGSWPLRCRIMRLDRKDRGDRFLFWVGPPDEGN